MNKSGLAPLITTFLIHSKNKNVLIPAEKLKPGRFVQLRLKRKRKKLSSQKQIRITSLDYDILFIFEESVRFDSSREDCCI